VSSERQLSGYSIELEGLGESEQLLEVAVPYTMRQAVERGLVPREFRFATFSRLRGGSSGVCGLPIGSDLANDSDASVLAWALEAHRILAESLPAFSASRVTAHSPCVLHRDGGAVEGQYILTEEDVVEGRRFEDAALKCAWPVEFWHQDRGPEYRYVAKGTYYEIPRRCLRSARIDNLFLGGRCLSASARALASCRVAGTCLASGEAAALAAEEALGPRSDAKHR
jgi:hypothetical protein